MRPAVSVIIPTFNRAELLPRAIESVIAQTHDDWEIVVVDDGSTDDTRAVVGDYARRIGDRFRSVLQENRGASAARNRGIEASRGSFIAFLDSDDEFIPTKLERQLRFFEARPELGFIYSDYSFIDLDGERHASAFRTKFPIALEVPATPVGPGQYICTTSLFDTLIRGYFIATIVGLIRREVLGDDLRFDESQSYAEEWLFHLRVARRCAAGFVDDPLSLHHYTPSSLARNDKQRNSIRRYGLLKTIYSTFPEMTKPQRAIVRRNLATAARQVCYDAIGEGAKNVAVRYAWNALKLSHGPRAIVQSFSALRSSVFATTSHWDRTRREPTLLAQAVGGTVR